MAHEIDITNGVASFVSARKPAWHQLGTVLDDVFDGSTALEEANLADWNTRKLPLSTTDPDSGLTIPVPDRFAVVRDNPVTGSLDALGVVGAPYVVVQNEAHVRFLDDLVDQSGAHFETAGAIRGGRQTFVSMRLPDHINVGGVDPVLTYLVALNSHDGSMPFTVMTTKVRPVCANTVTLGFRQASHVYKIRHTQHTTTRMQAARDAISMTFKYDETFAEVAERLVNIDLTDSRFEEIVTAEFGTPEDAPKIAQTIAGKKIEAITDLFAHSETHADVRNTAWAGWNAVVEWMDHFSPAQGSDPDTSRALRSALDGDVEKRKTAFADRLLALDDALI